MHKTYRGFRTYAPTIVDGGVQSEKHEASGVRVVVREDGRERDLDPRLDIRNHSPTGLNWGYGGSGPAQLALALACDCYGDDVGSDPKVYETLKAEVVSALQDEWELPAWWLQNWLRERNPVGEAN